MTTNRRAKQDRQRMDQSPEIPRVISEGTVEIGPFIIKVYNLNNGQRVIDAADTEKVLRWLEQQSE